MHSPTVSGSTISKLQGSVLERRDIPGICIILQHCASEVANELKGLVGDVDAAVTQMKGVLSHIVRMYVVLSPPHMSCKGIPHLFLPLSRSR